MLLRCHVELTSVRFPPKQLGRRRNMESILMRIRLVFAAPIDACLGVCWKRWNTRRTLRTDDAVAKTGDVLENGLAVRHGAYA